MTTLEGSSRITELCDVAFACDIEMDEAIYLEEIGVIKKEADGSYDCVACMVAVLANMQRELNQMIEIQKSMR